MRMQEETIVVWSVKPCARRLCSLSLHANDHKSPLFPFLILTCSATDYPHVDNGRWSKRCQRDLWGILPRKKRRCHSQLEYVRLDVNHVDNGVEERGGMG